MVTKKKKRRKWLLFCAGCTGHPQAPRLVSRLAGNTMCHFQTYLKAAHFNGRLICGNMQTFLCVSRHLETLTRHTKCWGKESQINGWEYNKRRVICLKVGRCGVIFLFFIQTVKKLETHMQTMTSQDMEEKR